MPQKGDDLMESFSGIFKESRQRKNIGFEELSKKIGVAPSVLFKYENGETFPREKPLKKICQFFKLDFGTWSKLIIEEKREKTQKKQNARIYGNALYPEMRKTFLDAYCVDYATSSRKAISQKGMIKEFGHSSLHPIEKKLLEITNHRLHAAKLINLKKSIISNIFSPEEKKDLFKKVISDWGYIPSTRQLLITVEKKKGELTTVCYKMGISWQEEKQQSVNG